MVHVLCNHVVCNHLAFASCYGLLLKYAAGRLRQTEPLSEYVLPIYVQAEAAKHIVVAGAGIVGVEVAAELGAKYKDTDKKITLVGTFLRQTPSLAGHCSSVLESYGVHLMPGRTGDWHEGDKKVKIGDKEIECDLLLPCTGKHAEHILLVLGTRVLFSSCH